jgi:hypothetical protein
MATSAEHVVEVFNCATEENQINSLREHQVINLPAEGELLVAGDLHDNRRNFEKIVKLANLGKHPQRHLILQELIHGDHIDANGAEDSWHMLAKAAELKCDYPRQVHFLLANHDLAQIHGEGIMKGGKSQCEQFNAGVSRDFGDRHLDVQLAITEFLLSFPLAVRCANGLFFCHSLPTDDQVPNFDYTVFNRPLSGPDYKRRTGPVYQLVWGRGTTPIAAERFAKNVNAAVCVCGHQPQENGYLANGDYQLIIASEHSQGTFLAVDLSRQYDMPKLLGRLKKFAAVEIKTSED